MSLIGQRASVSKSDFYKHFDSKDDCFFAAYEAAIERIRGEVVASCAAHGTEPWSPRVRDAIAALLRPLAADPALASISLVEGLRAGRGVYDRYQAAVESFVRLPPRRRPGRRRAAETVPAATDEAVVGGIASLLGRRVLAGEAEQIDKLLPRRARVRPDALPRHRPRRGE